MASSRGDTRPRQSERNTKRHITLKNTRVPLRNYKKIRNELWAIVEQCDKKTAASGRKGRMNPGPLRKKLARIYRLIEKGSYPNASTSETV
jgi:hypothetical protein